MPYTSPTNDGTAFIMADTIRIESSLNGTTSCTFETVDETGSFRFNVGEQVVLEDDTTSTRVFAGIVFDTIERVTPGSDALRCSVRCVDFGQLLERHVVAQAFDNTSLIGILQALHSGFMSADGLALSITSNGNPTFDRMVFNYRRLSECLTELAGLTGNHWYVTDDKVVVFGPRAATPSGFTLTDATQTWSNLRVERSLEEYRNTQILRAGEGLTEPRVEYFIPVGAARTFTLAFNVGTAPSVNLGGIGRTVGILGVDTGKDLYWNKGSPTITADDSLSIDPAWGMNVSYRGLIPILVRAQNDTEIAVRAGVQADAGMYEHFEQDRSIDSLSLALSKTTGLLRKFGTPRQRVMFTMDSVTGPAITTLRVGQSIPITLERHGIDGDYLVERIVTRDVGLEFYRYEVTCAQGETHGAFTEFFRKLAQQQVPTFDANEVLMLMKSNTDSIAIGEGVNVFTTPV